jgi:ABC-type Na+ efflux pump permease subunit
MKKEGLTGWTKVFAFTFSQHVKKQGWRAVTVIVALVLLIGISAGMFIYEYIQKNKEVLTKTDITEVLIVDSSKGSANYDYLNMLGDPIYNKLVYTPVSGTEEALGRLGRTNLILDVSTEGSAYSIKVVLPEETDIDKKDAEAFKNFISGWFSYILIQKSDIEISELSELSIPVMSSVMTDGETKDEGVSAVKDVMEYLLPYAVILLIYMLVLIYGTGVAMSAISEKSSKLMDFFLITIRPAAMMLGKVLAMALAGLIQLLIWVGGAVGGCAIGAALVRAYNPQTSMGLLKFFDVLGEASGMFQTLPIIISFAVIIAGFLLYCSIAAIGGSLASKTEDLSSTNVLFTLILVASFFIAMYGGGSGGGMISKAEWLIYVPFTAVLVTPVRLIMGDIGLLQGLISLALTLILMLLGVILAGKVYTLTTFWRGNPPKLSAVLKMIRSNKEQA